MCALWPCFCRVLVKPGCAVVCLQTAAGAPSLCSKLKWVKVWAVSLCHSGTRGTCMLRRVTHAACTCVLKLGGQECAVSLCHSGTGGECVLRRVRVHACMLKLGPMGVGWQQQYPPEQQCRPGRHKLVLPSAELLNLYGVSMCVCVCGAFLPKVYFVAVTKRGLAPIRAQAWLFDPEYSSLLKGVVRRRRCPFCPV
jgi:hypothetical protein